MADSSTNLYQPITLNVSNAAGGQKFAVQVSGNGVPVAFSAGPAFQTDVHVTAQSGCLSLSYFSITASEMVFMTSTAGGDQLSFQVTAFLVAEPAIDSFYLYSGSDPGLQVTAAIGNGSPQVVNQSRTLFSWRPCTPPPRSSGG